MRWNLRMKAAERGIWKSTELRRLLAEAGLEISAGKMSALWTGTPTTIRLDDLDVICAVLQCRPSDLLNPEPDKVAARRPAKTAPPAPAATGAADRRSRRGWAATAPRPRHEQPGSAVHRLPRDSPVAMTRSTTASRAGPAARSPRRRVCAADPAADYFAGGQCRTAATPRNTGPVESCRDCHAWGVDHGCKTGCATAATPGAPSTRTKVTAPPAAAGRPSALEGVCRLCRKQAGMVRDRPGQARRHRRQPHGQQLYLANMFSAGIGDQTSRHQPNPTHADDGICARSTTNNCCCSRCARPRPRAVAP